MPSNAGAALPLAVIACEVANKITRCANRLTVVAKYGHIDPLLAVTSVLADAKQANNGAITISAGFTPCSLFTAMITTYITANAS